MSKRIVLFTLPGCGPCKLFKPTFVEASKDTRSKGIEYEIKDASEHPAEANMAGVQSVPTTVFYEDGNPIASFQGPVHIEALFAKISEYFSN